MIRLGKIRVDDDGSDEGLRMVDRVVRLKVIVEAFIAWIQASPAGAGLSGPATPVTLVRGRHAAIRPQRYPMRYP